MKQTLKIAGRKARETLQSLRRSRPGSLKLALLLFALALAHLVFGGMPMYKTSSAGGNGTAGASVTFAADPTCQIRVVSLYYESDTNTAALHFYSPSQAYAISVANTNAAYTTNTLSTTAGIPTNGASLLLVHGGTYYTGTIVSTNCAGGSTNFMLAAGGFGSAVSANDDVYVLGAAGQSLTVGAATNSLNGEAIYVGNYGRPVVVKLTPALTTNRINSISVHYDSAGW